MHEAEWLSAPPEALAVMAVFPRVAEAAADNVIFCELPALSEKEEGLAWMEDGTSVKETLICEFQPFSP